jgi:hypothetical protein
MGERGAGGGDGGDVFDGVQLQRVHGADVDDGGECGAGELRV